MSGPQGNPSEDQQGRFFAVMRNPSTRALIPFMTDSGVLITWLTAKAAREALKGHIYAEAWPTEIYEFGGGEDL